MSSGRRNKCVGQLPLIDFGSLAVKDEQAPGGPEYRAGSGGLPLAPASIPAHAPWSVTSSTATAGLPGSWRSEPVDPTPATTGPFTFAAGSVPAKEASAMADSSAAPAATRSASAPASGTGDERAEASASAQIIQVDKALESWRDAGFDLNSAIGEVIDNSIEAAATRIRIRTYPRGDKPKIIDTIAFSDDGVGIDSQTLPHVLTLGYSSRYGQRSGLGRFGVGLKLAALSHARRLDIYTRQLGEAGVLHAWLDLDDIRDGSQTLILSETLPDFPGEHSDLVLSDDGDPYESGTLVVWNKVDRLKTGGRYKTDLAQQLSEVQTFLARAYRRFLDKGVSIDLNGRDTELHDPTFQLDSPRVNKKVGKRVQGQLITRDTINVDEHQVTITVAIPADEIIQRRGRGDAQFLKDLNIGPSTEGKISFLRQGREISYELVQNFYPTRVVEADRYVAVEIEFPATLDEYFQVRHVKKGAEPVDKLRTQLRASLRRPLEAARKRLRDQWDLMDAASSSGNDDHEEAEKAAAAADTTAPRGRAGGQLSPREQKDKVDKVVSDLTDDLAAGADASDDPGAMERVAEVADKLRETIEALPFTIADRTWPGKEMLDITHLNGKAIVILNHGHPFIRDVYDAAQSMAARSADEVDPAEALRFARRMKVGFDLLFMAYAKAENMHPTPDSYYGDLRMFWGQAAASYITEVAPQI